MKKVLTLFLISVLILGMSLFGVSFGKNEVNQMSNVSSENFLTVTGQGVVYVKPDVAYISVGVEIERKTAKEAAEENAKIMDQIVKALLKLGVKEDELETVEYSISPVYFYPQNEPPVVTGYKVRNVLNIKITKKTQDGKLDTKFIGEVLDATTTNGANVVYGITFDILDKNELKLKAIEFAMEDAKKKAETALNTIGEKIKGVQEINISDISFPVIRYDLKTMPAPEITTPIYEGLQSIQVTVNVKFIF
ncbi:MAG: SIMPL domain-containing protein [Caldisericia bacterium]|jgi:uncharacterized protein YggE|nr:SIMPL domain-containing protein [Caldisericia bacterium]